MNINQLEEMVIKHVESQVEKNQDQYIECGGYIRIDAQIALEQVLENNGLEIDDNTFELVVNNISGEVESIEKELRDNLTDEEYYRRDPLGYHGMSIRDFI